MTREEWFLLEGPFAPSSWTEVFNATGWRPSVRQTPKPITVDDLLRAEIRLNEELRKQHEEFQKWKASK